MGSRSMSCMQGPIGISDLIAEPEGPSMVGVASVMTRQPCWCVVARAARVFGHPGGPLILRACRPADRRTVSSRTPNASEMRGLVQPDSVSYTALTR